MRDRLFLAALSLLVGAGIAGSAVAASTQATPWPFTPPRDLKAGDLIVGVSEWDGKAFTVIGGLTLQGEAGLCTAPIRPEVPLG